MARRLTLRHSGKVFLDRWGLETRWFGLFVHHIAGPDPGLDLHDHPWPFVSLILRGGYREEYAGIDIASAMAAIAEREGQARRGATRRHRRFSVHRLPLTVAHRIISTEQDTWTLVIRGRKARSWGFYQPEGWVHWQSYDYATRRPNDVESSNPEERTTCGNPRCDDPAHQQKERAYPRPAFVPKTHQNAASPRDIDANRGER